MICYPGDLSEDLMEGRHTQVGNYVLKVYSKTNIHVHGHSYRYIFGEQVDIYADHNAVSSIP